MAVYGWKDWVANNNWLIMQIFAIEVQSGYHEHLSFMLALLLSCLDGTDISLWFYLLPRWRGIASVYVVKIAIFAREPVFASCAELLFLSGMRGGMPSQVVLPCKCHATCHVVADIGLLVVVHVEVVLEDRLSRKTLSTSFA
jgi:hypothetical protein